MRAAPRLWHPSDKQRLATETALELLPYGSAWIFREYGAPNRRARVTRLAATARRKRLITLLAGDHKLAWRLYGRNLAAGVHFSGQALRRSPGRHRPFHLKSAACHSIPQGLQALKHGANILLISPVYATASHPKQRPLGLFRTRIIMRELRKKHLLHAIALGGVNHRRLCAIKHSGLDGVAAIEWLGHAGKARLRRVARHGRSY